MPVRAAGAPGRADLEDDDAAPGAHAAEAVLPCRGAHGVDDVHHNAGLVQWRDLDADDSSSRRMAHRILDEILEHAFDHADVGVHLRMLNGDEPA